MTYIKDSKLYKTDRLEMFSDGIFAIAITLLVLEIKIPKHEDLAVHGGLFNYIKDIWPSYFSYVITFFSIGIYWANHHWLFSFVRRTNHTFNLLNIFFLMTIAFMPFPAAILGDYIMDAEYCNAAVATYCAGALLCSLIVLFVVRYAVKNNRLTDANLNKPWARAQIVKIVASNVICSIALILAFYYPMASITLICLIYLMFLIPPSTPIYDEEGKVI